MSWWLRIAVAAILISCVCFRRNQRRNSSKMADLVTSHSISPVRFSASGLTLNGRRCRFITKLQHGRMTAPVVTRCRLLHPASFLLMLRPETCCHECGGTNGWVTHQYRVEILRKCCLNNQSTIYEEVSQEANEDCTVIEIILTCVWIYYCKQAYIRSCVKCQAL